MLASCCHTPPTDTTAVPRTKAASAVAPSPSSFCCFCAANELSTFRLAFICQPNETDRAEIDRQTDRQRQSRQWDQTHTETKQTGNQTVVASASAAENYP